MDAILKTLGARALVIGHTPMTGTITPRFENRVFPIDTGMLGGTFYPGGVASALEIRGDTVTAIYEQRREPLGSLGGGGQVLNSRTVTQCHDTSVTVRQFKT